LGEGGVADTYSSLRKADWTGKSISGKSYLAGLIILFAAAYFQYLISGLGPIFGTLLVYGVPILGTSLLWGRPIIRRAFSRKYDALKFGLGFFGVLSVLGMLLSIAFLYIIIAFDPRAVSLLNRPNPVLNVSPGFAWIMVGISILIVGPAEEYLFRGFVYGGLLSIFKGRHWIILAFISSILFGAAHLYYAIVYGVSSLLPFTDLVTFGMAMAMTYYLSGGDLAIPAVIHGLYDAAGFVGVAASPELGTLLRWSMTIAGVLVAIALIIQRIHKREHVSRLIG
jgi:membrane protease YdiL (CAAX protease family)